MVWMHTEELGSLRHGKTDEVVLALRTIARRATSLVEHLEGLHSGSRAHAARTGWVRLTSTAVELLVLSHSIVFIDVPLLCLVTRKHAKGIAEQVRVSRIASMLGRGVGCGRVVVRTAGDVAIRSAARVPMATVAAAVTCIATTVASFVVVTTVASFIVVAAAVASITSTITSIIVVVATTIASVIVVVAATVASIVVATVEAIALVVARAISAFGVV